MTAFMNGHHSTSSTPSPTPTSDLDLESDGEGMTILEQEEAARRRGTMQPTLFNSGDVNSTSSSVNSSTTSTPPLTPDNSTPDFDNILQEEEAMRERAQQSEGGLFGPVKRPKGGLYGPETTTAATETTTTTTTPTPTITTTTTAEPEGNLERILFITFFSIILVCAGLAMTHLTLTTCLKCKKMMDDMIRGNQDALHAACQNIDAESGQGVAGGNGNNDDDDDGGSSGNGGQEEEEGDALPLLPQDLAAAAAAQAEAEAAAQAEAEAEAQAQAAAEALNPQPSGPVSKAGGGGKKRKKRGTKIFGSGFPHVQF